MSGNFISKTKIVITMAKIPSDNCSNLFGFIRLNFIPNPRIFEVYVIDIIKLIYNISFVKNFGGFSSTLL